MESLPKTWRSSGGIKKHAIKSSNITNERSSNVKFLDSTQISLSYRTRYLNPQQNLVSNILKYRTQLYQNADLRSYGGEK